MSLYDAKALLLSEPCIVLDEQSCRNAEDSETMAVIAIDIAGRDKIVKMLESAEHEIHELKRTRSEAEAAARVEGYKQGRRDCQEAIRSLIGL